MCYSRIYFILCCIGITLGCLVFNNLSGIFDPAQNSKLSDFHLFSFIFFHGFDDLSGILHLLLNIYFFAVVGMIAEKVLGSIRYFFVLIISILMYGFSMTLFDIYAPSATGIIWCLMPIVFFILLEGRRIKTRSMYEENYSFLRINLIVLCTVLPIFTVFLQFYLSKESISTIEAIRNGIVPFIICSFIGLIMAYFLRGHIKSKLKSFNRKKKLEYSEWDKKATWLSMLFPLYLFLLLYIHRFI